MQIVRSSAITLWADRGSLPVVVENNLSQAVTVYIRVRPSLPLLRVEDDFVELTIEPNSQRKAQIPVQSISNGDVDLQISLQEQRRGDRRHHPRPHDGTGRVGDTRH